MRAPLHFPRLAVAAMAGLALLAACDRDGSAALTEQLRAKLVRTLKDPDSAKIRDARLSAAGALCGEVNAKNSMGGYTGFARFVVTPTGVLLDGDPPNEVWDHGSPDTDALLEMLKVKADFLKEANASPGTFGDQVRRMSDRERDEIIMKRYFRAVWDSRCAQTDAKPSR